MLTTQFWSFLIAPIITFTVSWWLKNDMNGWWPSLVLNWPLHQASFKWKLWVSRNKNSNVATWMFTVVSYLASFSQHHWNPWRAPQKHSFALDTGKCLAELMAYSFHTPSLFLLDQTMAQRGKNFQGAPPWLKTWMSIPPPTSMKVWTHYWFLCDGVRIF